MKDPREIIDHLSHEDALAMLRTLAESDEALAQRIAEIAMTRLDAVDPGELAEILYCELDMLRVEEVWDRAGPTRDGYVEPCEAVEQIVEETMAPFLEELAKYQGLAMHTEAKHMCMGLLLGLYRFKHESNSEFKEWATDAPIVFAEIVLDAWWSGSPSRADIAEVKAFIEEELHDWRNALSRSP